MDTGSNGERQTLLNMAKDEFELVLREFVLPLFPFPIFPPSKKPDYPLKFIENPDDSLCAKGIRAYVQHVPQACKSEQENDSDIVIFSPYCPKPPFAFYFEARREEISGYPIKLGCSIIAALTKVMPFQFELTQTDEKAYTRITPVMIGYKPNEDNLVTAPYFQNDFKLSLYRVAFEHGMLNWVETYQDGKSSQSQTENKSEKAGEPKATGFVSCLFNHLKRWDLATYEAGDVGFAFLITGLDVDNSFDINSETSFVNLLDRFKGAARLACEAESYIELQNGHVMPFSSAGFESRNRLLDEEQRKVLDRISRIIESDNPPYKQILNEDFEVRQIKDVLAPYDMGRLAVKTDESEIGVIYQTNGDLFFFKQERIILSRRSGKWFSGNSVLFDTLFHNFYLDCLPSQYQKASIMAKQLKSEVDRYRKPLPKEQKDEVSSWDEVTQTKHKLRKAMETALFNKSKVASHTVFLTCLDVSCAHTGGCLCVVSKDNSSLEKLQEFIMPTDIILDENAEKNEKAKTYAALIQGVSFYMLPRTRRRELLSIDGATIIKPEGTIVAVGAIVSVDPTQTDGARSASAQKLAQYGIAIKISADGDVDFYIHASKPQYYRIV